MVGEMEKRLILKNFFDDLSEDEDLGTNHELNYQADSVNDENGTLEPEKEGKTISKEDTKLENEARSSRLCGTEKDENLDLHLAAVIRDVFGDSEDDEQADYGVQNQTNQGICSGKELRSGIVVTDGEVPKTAAEEHDENRTKGEEAGNQLVFEIPMYPSLAHPNQTATVDFSNLIAIDPMPFDPATHVEQEFFAEDASGFKRLIPFSNIIRWREVKNPDGTTSVESNAHFVTWSDGSLQLLIGNKAFDVSEHNVLEIQSQFFPEHWKETKLDLASSSNAPAEGTFWISESEIMEPEPGQNGHEGQDACCDGKLGTRFEQVEGKCNDYEIEAEVSDNFTKSV